MRTLLFATLLSVMCITAVAQTADTMLTDKFLLNFAVPDMPAAKALGTDASGLLRPSDVQKFAASFQPFYSGGQGVIPKNFALEFAPWKQASRKWTLSDYNHGIKSLLYNSAFSIATVRDTSSYASKLSIGYHLTIGSKNSDILKAVHYKSLAAIEEQQKLFTGLNTILEDWVYSVAGLSTGADANEIETYEKEHMQQFVDYLQNKWRIYVTDSVEVIAGKLSQDRALLLKVKEKELKYKDSLEKEYCKCLFRKDSLMQLYRNGKLFTEPCCICTSIRDTLQKLYYANVASADLPEKICCRVDKAGVAEAGDYEKALPEQDKFKAQKFRDFLNIYLIKNTAQFDSFMKKFKANDPFKFIADSVQDLITHWKDSMWNAGRWDIALAYTAASKDTLIKNAQFSSFNLWVTKACQLGKWGQLLLGGSLALPRTEKNDTVTTNTSYTLNARLYAGGNSIKGFFETQYQYQNYSGYKKALLFNLGAEFSIGQQFWVVASTGINNYLGLSNPLGVLVSGVSLRYGFNKPK